MRTKQYRIPTPLAAAIAATLLGSSPAYAQTPTDQPSQLQAASAQSDQSHDGEQQDATSLPTVVVTANKRSEDVQDVGMGMSVLDGYRLERIHATSFRDYLVQVPGVNLISGGPGHTQIVMRGVTSGSRQPNSSVGTYIDGAPFGSSTIYALGRLLTPDIDPADLRRLEVLRGPQGTLYGANTLGGLVKFVTQPPNTEWFSGYVQFDANTVADGGNGGGVRGMVNVPLVRDTLAMRANVYRRNDPGYIDDVGKGEENVNKAMENGGRVQLLWTPSDKVSLRMFGLFHSLHSDGLANGGVDVEPSTLEPLNGELTSKHPAGTGLFDLKYRLYNANLNVELGWARLVSSTSYQSVDLKRNFDLSKGFGPIVGGMFDISDPGLSERTPLTQRKLTQEVRLQSPTEQKLEWRLGLFYTHEHSDFGQVVDSFDKQTGEPLPLPNLEDVMFGPALFTEQALYADLTYHFTPRFSVLVGARYTHDKTEFTQVGEGLLVGDSNFTTTGVDNPVTYLVNPTFRLADNVMLYARAASGFRPGGPNLGVPPNLGAPTTFGPDKLVNYELGLKSSLLQHRMKFNIDAFYIDWSEIQLETTLNGIGFLSNGGQARSRGVEAAWSYRPVGGLTLTANAAWTDAELSGETPSGLVGGKGDVLPYVPRVNASAGADYDFPIGDGWSAYIGGNYRYVSSRKTNFQSVPGARFELPSYNTLDLRVGVNYANWTLGLYAKNLTNSRGISLLKFETTDPTGGPYAASYIQPRLLGITATVNF